MDAWVADYVGIPFLIRGRDREGVDCYGLCRLVLEERFHKRLPDFKSYQSLEDRQFIALLIDANKPTIDARQVEMPLPGDLVLLHFYGLPIHIGIYVGSGHMLHVMKGCDTAVERLDSGRIAGRVKGFYRVM